MSHSQLLVAYMVGSPPRTFTRLRLRSVGEAWLGADLLTPRRQAPELFRQE